MAALVTNDRGAEEIDRIIEACVDGFRSRSTPHQERGFSFQGRGVAGAPIASARARGPSALGSMHEQRNNHEENGRGSLAQGACGSLAMAAHG
jgi:hypothetical protein